MIQMTEAEAAKLFAREDAKLAAMRNKAWLTTMIEVKRADHRGKCETVKLARSNIYAAIPERDRLRFEKGEAVLSLNAAYAIQKVVF